MHARIHRGARLTPRLAAIITLAVSLAGCSVWDLGPQPDNYVGPGRGTAPRSFTDSNLRAVVPVVPGDQGGGAALPGAAMPGAGMIPATMPAATQPTTVLPATRSANPTVQGAPPQPENNPALGQAGPMNQPNATHVEIPSTLSVQDAILVGLQNNINLRVQRYGVPINRTAEERALAAFDPTVTGSLQGGRNVNGGRTSDSITGTASVTENLPTGTAISAGVTTSNSLYSDASSTLSATATVTQSLLRGAGLDVNLATLRSAELSTKISQYQLRGVAESLVQNIENAYWDLAFAERQVLIVQNSVDVAQRQYNDTNQRVQIQRLAPSELPAAQASLAQQRESLINAKSTLETARMKFMQLITPATGEFWNRTISLTTIPFIPTGTMDPVDAHVAVAMRLRPDLNEAKLEIQRGDLTIVQTKNGLLPRLDLFFTLGKTALGSNFSDSFGGINGPDYQAVLGVKGDWEPINRAAIASYRSSLLSREQLQETLDNTMQTVQLDVRTQYIEVERTRQQIDATRAMREAQQATLQVAQGKLAAGNGTSLDVAIAQRDLLTDQLNEVQAVTSHLKALVDLYRLEGSLLYRRGLDAPGGQPVEGIAWKR